ncbi:hypothetical protein OXX79_011899, partial [Metschnikowia pulcherrima]
KEKVLVLAEDTLGAEQDNLSAQPKLKTERKTKKNKFIIDTLNLESLDMDSSEAANETTTKPFEYEVDLEQLRTQFADESVKKADKEKKKSKKKREQSKDVGPPKTSVGNGVIAEPPVTESLEADPTKFVSSDSLVSVPKKSKKKKKKAIIEE